MSKELDKLIEQVLLERNLTNIILPNDSDELIDDPQTPEQKLPWEKLGAKPDSQQDKKNVEVLAAAAGDQNVLTQGDIQAAILNNLGFFEKGSTQTEIPGAFVAIQKMLNKGADDYKTIIQDIIDKALLDSPKVETDPKDIPELTKVILSKIAELPEERVSIGSQGLPQYSMETTQDDFKANKNVAKASPSLVNLFSSIEGNTIVDKLNSIMEFSTAAQEGTLSQWAANKDKFKVFTYAKVLVLFADEIKKSGYKEAGFIFERWLGMLLNMPVVGAEGGAADGIANFTGGVIYTSAKLYSNMTGEFAPKQSEKKLSNETKDGKSLFYFVGHKRKEKPAEKVQGFHYISSVDLYIIKISQDEGSLKGQFVDNSGQLVGQSWELQKSGGQRVLTPPNAEDITSSKFATIYLPGGEITDGQLQSTAEFLTTAIQGMKDSPATQAILEAALSIKRLEANASSYAAKSSDEKGTGTAYINKITDDYFALEDLYDKIFNYGQGTEQEPQKYVDPARLQESKLSLDKLIEAIIKQKLLK